MAKFRHDFVTNSSSASFIVTFKAIQNTELKDLYQVISGKQPPDSLLALMKEAVAKGQDSSFEGINIRYIQDDIYEASCFTSMDNNSWGDFDEHFEKFVALLQRRTVQDGEGNYVNIGFYGDGKYSDYHSVNVKLIEVKIDDDH